MDLLDSDNEQFAMKNSWAPALLSTVFLLGGCTVEGSTGGSLEPTLETIGTVSNEAQAARPVDVFLPSPGEILEVAHIQENAITDCYAKHGITGKYSFARNPSDLAMFINSSIRDRVVRSDLWAYFDTTNANHHGYKRPPGELGVLMAASPDGQETKFRDREAEILECIDRVRQDAPGEFDAIRLADSGSLPERGPTIPLNDSRYVEAVAKWSTCMKERGFNYSDPVAAIGDEQWSDTETADSQEIATATADIDCKISTNLVGIALAVQTAYDKQYIDTHQEALTQFRNDLDIYLRGPVTQN